MTDRSWYHPLEIIRNRYLVRIIVFIFHLIPVLVFDAQDGTIVLETESQTKELSAVAKAIEAFNIIGMIFQCVFILLYVFKKRNEPYQIVLCNSEFSGVKLEIACDLLLLLLLGFLGSYGIYISVCRQYASQIQQMGGTDGQTARKWCDKRSTMLAFALLSMAWYVIVIVLDVLTIRKKKGSGGSTMELNQTSKSAPTVPPAAASEASEAPAERKAAWPPEN